MGSSPGDMKQANPQEARKLSIQRCIQSLVHACQCRDANCRLPSCQKMKRVVTHTKICKRKTKGDCPICKQLIALCCYHAKHCQVRICNFLFVFQFETNSIIKRYQSSEDSFANKDLPLPRYWVLRKIEDLKILTFVCVKQTVRSQMSRILEPRNFRCSAGLKIEVQFS